MNRILLFEEERCERGGRRFRFGGRRARHVREVLGASVGQSLRVGLLNDRAGIARVVALDGESVEVECDLTTPVPRSGLSLIVAVPRARSLKRLLRDAAALGADRIVLLRTARVHKPYLSSAWLLPENFRPLLHDGMMQGGTTREPSVRVESLFRPYVEDRAAAEFSRARRLVAHPAADADLARIDLDARSEAVIAVGPEGGFVPFEIALFRRAGFEPVRSGERLLRVETAAVALLAQLDLLRRRALR